MRNVSRKLVPTVTLDELASAYSLLPDLVKIDVEGAEGLVLSGAKRCAANPFRRYSRAGLRTTIEAAGFRVERLRPLFRTLWPLAWLNARFTRGTAVADPVAEYKVSKPFNIFLRLLVRTEEALLHGSDRGRGTSWLVVARPKCRVADGSAA